MDVLVVFAYIFEAIIIEIYAKRTYKARWKWFVRLISYILIYGLMILFHSEKNIWRNTLFDVVAAFGVLYLMYVTDFLTAIYYSIIIVSINFMLELSFGNIISHYMNNFWQKWATLSSYIILTSGRIFLLVSVFIISHTQVKYKKSRDTKIEGIISSSLVLCIMTFLFILSGMIISVPYSHKTETLFFGAMVILAVILILTMTLFKYMQRKNNELIELQLHIQKNEDNQLYYKSIEQKDNNLRILIHDIKNHLQTLAFFNDEGEKDKIGKYIDDLVKKASLRAMVDISKNKLLNTIIFRYSTLAEEMGIKFTYDVRIDDISLIADIDITTIMCNVLDNALENCKSDNSYIDLAIYKENVLRALIITVVNSCDKPPIISKAGQFVSMKENKDIHGIGLKSVKNTVDKYEGELQLYYDDDDKSFHTIVMVREGKNEDTNM